MIVDDPNLMWNDGLVSDLLHQHFRTHKINAVSTQSTDNGMASCFKLISSLNSAACLLGKCATLFLIPVPSRKFYPNEDFPHQPMEYILHVIYSTFLFIFLGDNI